MTKAQVVDEEFVMKKKILFQKKEQEAEKNAEAIAAKAKTKAQNDAVVVGKGKGKAAVVGGMFSKTNYKEERERGTYDLLPCIFAYSNNTYRYALW